MANVFEDILKEIKNDQIKAALAGLPSDDPDRKLLEEHMMRQSEFSKHHDRLRSLEEANTNWHKFNTDTLPELSKAQERIPQLQTELETAQNELAQLKAKYAAVSEGDGNGTGKATAEAFEKALKALEDRLKPMLMTPEREKAIKEAAVKEALDTSRAVDLPFVIGTEDLYRRAQREYADQLGTPLPDDFRVNLMDAIKKTGKPEDAYKVATMALAEQKRQKDTQAQIQKGVEEGIQKWKVEQATKGNPEAADFGLGGLPSFGGTAPDLTKDLPADFDPVENPNLLGAKAAMELAKMRAAGQIRE